MRDRTETIAITVLILLTAVQVVVTIILVADTLQAAFG